MPTTIVTDSTCDLTADVARQYGIEIVPLPIAFGTERFLDGVDLTRANFYTKLAAAKDLPVSSPPVVEQLTQMFQKHLRAGNDVVCIVISSGLSETYKNAQAAVQQAGSPENLVLIDSKTFSGGLGLAAIYAAELAKTGTPAKQIAAYLEKFTATQRGFMTLPDLSHLARSGRINKAQVMLGTVMKIIPILRLTSAGLIEGEAQTRTFEKAQELLVEIAMRYIPRPADTRVMVAHAHAPELGQTIATNLRQKLSAPLKSCTVTEAGPAVAVNAGPGAVAIFSAEG